MMETAARGKIALVHYGETPGGHKRRPANLAIVDYRHSEVALIEIMIGGLLRRAALRVRENETKRKRERGRETEGKRRGDLKL